MTGLLMMATKSTKIFALTTGFLVMLIVIGFPIPVHGQTQDFVLSNVVIDAILNQNCTTSISIEADIVNNGSVDLSFIDLRLDIRSLNVTNSVLGGGHAETVLEPKERYSMVRVSSASLIPLNSTSHLSLMLTTNELQQRQDPSPTGPLCTNHFIYYIRPLNEIQGLTFRTHLPAHATLEADAPAPLFPVPTSNFTDGNRMVFTWETAVLRPGEEQAFIVKYQLPTGLLQTDSSEPVNLLLFAGVGVAIGAVAALSIERLPTAIRQLRTKRESTISVVSSQEQQVLALLDGKGGSCLQREIYEELNMSQSMASMLLNSLEERGLIKRFRDGRENMVHKMET
ncbi:MAG: helix-turn-helix transcriptional regulator [Candidatus Thorarchaeota archaeon]